MSEESADPGPPPLVQTFTVIRRMATDSHPLERAMSDLNSSTTGLDFKVADISLAGFGRKEIRLA